MVPEIASRKHLENITPVISQALSEAGVKIDDIDLIGVTHGPGLVGALIIGVAAAKGAVFAKDIPLVGSSSSPRPYQRQLHSRSAACPPRRWSYLAAIRISSTSEVNDLELLGRVERCGREAMDKDGPGFRPRLSADRRSTNLRKKAILMPMNSKGSVGKRQL